MKQHPRPAAATSSRPTVAIINDVPDIAAMLAVLFISHGLDVVPWAIGHTRRGEPCVRPGRSAAALVWDVSIPGSASWRAFELLAHAAGRPRPEIILTTSNRGLLVTTARLIQADNRIVQAPYDLDALLAAVRTAVSSSGLGARIASTPLPDTLRTLARIAAHHGTPLEVAHV